MYLFGTTADGNLVLVLQSRTEDGVLPVGTCSEKRWVGIVRVAVTDFANAYKVVVILGILAQVHHLKSLGLARKREHTVVVDLCIAGLTPLGCNQHDTVCTLGTVNRRCGGILEDFHADDIGRVDC